MKARILALKAPWPQGAKVGDVVEFAGDHAPGWAIGKFERVGDDATPTVAFAEKADAVEHPEVARLRQAAEHAAQAAAADLDKMREAFTAETRNLKADHAAQVAALEARIAQAEAGSGAKLQELTDANAKLAAELAAEKAAHATTSKAKGGK